MALFHCFLWLSNFPLYQFSSITQLCLTLCDPMDCRTPVFPVHHQLSEFAQTHVLQVSDAIQPSHPLSSSSLAFNLSSGSFIRVFSNDSVLCIRWSKYWSFSFSISPSNECSGLISFWLILLIDWFDLLAVQGTLKSLLQYHSSKASFLWYSAFFRRRQWHPTPVLLPGKSRGWRSLVGCSPWGREEWDTTERLHLHFSLSCIGEGNGNPLQCSCLENPRDGRAWWAAVSGVAQSQTRLKWLSSSSSFLYGPTLTSIHNYWKNHSYDWMDLCQQSNVSAFNMLSMLVIAFLPKSKCLLNS